MKSYTLVLDEKAKGLAKNYLRTEAALLSLLMEMTRRRVFPELNFSGVFDYCERRLKLSRAQSYYFQTVASKSEEVPELKRAVTSGELTLSQARRIVPVLSKQNHVEWVEKAKVLTQKELEREVAAVNPRARIEEKLKPVAKELLELRVAVSDKTEADLNALKDILSQKLKRAATLGDVVAWAAETTREKFDPIRKAERSQNISSRKPAAQEVANTAAGRQPIPAGVRHPVILRDRAQCTHVSPDGRRCEQKRWLHYHHVVEVSKGGRNRSGNLRLLCQAHHRWLHRSKYRSGPNADQREATQTVLPNV